MKINSHTQNQGGEGCLVMEAGAKFHPKTREGASSKDGHNSSTTPEKTKSKPSMTTDD